MIEGADSRGLKNAILSTTLPEYCKKGLMNEKENVKKFNCCCMQGVHSGVFAMPLAAATISTLMQACLSRETGLGNKDSLSRP